MELWLVIRGGRKERTVAVEADDTHTIGDLQQAAGASPGVWVLERTSTALEPADKIVASGLRSGDVVQVAPQAPDAKRSAQGGLQLVVAGGPAAGLTYPLPDGYTVVGRATSVDVVIGDPSLSRRHLRLTVQGTVVHVQDEASSHGTFLQGDRLEAAVPLPPGALIEAGRTALRVEPVRDDAPRAGLKDGRLQFSRPPRRRLAELAVVHKLPAPPDKLAPRRIPLVSALLPLVAVPFYLMGGNSNFLVLALLSPVTAIASVLEDRRNGGKDREKKLEEFYAELAAVSARMAAGIKVEAAARWSAAPDPAEALRRSAGPSSLLWERRPNDADFLCLRAGWADQPSFATWTLADGGDDLPRREVATELDQYTVAASVPVVVDLNGTRVVGITGSEDDVEESSRWLVAQAAVLHSPRDVTIAVAVTDARAPSWEWVSWLPHARPDAVPFAAHPVAVGADAARALVGSLNDLVVSRKQQGESRLSAAAAALPVVLLVLDEQLPVPRSTVAALLEEGPAVGVRILWLGARPDGLPGETGTIVQRDEKGVTTTTVASGLDVGPGEADHFTVAQATALARSLAGIRDATARTRGGGELPSFVSLPELLGLAEPTAAAVESAWSRHTGALGAPIGVSDDGPFVIDLRRDGPHALLGGTTGAGKSELLQTFVASLAARIPPTRLTFLLVDYKGGAAFKDCVALPHVVGNVTDLDGHLVHRALVSLNAELHRRERLLAAVGAKDLIEMERKSPEQAPAALLLVIDEFATLAKELPEFVDGVVNVAQRGRSLGIHMLLATQRPAGAINDNIRANTNLRMALRMNDEADSDDVINAKVAAALPRSLPGRAFARTGASELTEVQVGYSGGHTLAGGDERPIEVLPLRWGRVERPEKVRVVEDDSRPTDLQRVVEVVREAHAHLQLPPQPPPWLPPLPEVLPLADVGMDGGTAVATIGLLDLPARQSQLPYGVDLESEGSLLIFGTSGAGKTSLLRTIALSLAQRNSPADLHLYALDFASRGLGSLEALPHCGAVIGGDDIERTQRLFTMLDRAIAQRKQLFADAGVTSLSEYARAGDAQSPLARIVVLLDSYGGFASVFEPIEYGARLDALPQLVSEGRPLGIHFVITADRRNAVPLALSSTVSAKVVLRLADADEYSMLGLDGRIAKAAVLPAGRGFQSDTLEVQSAIVGASAAGDAQIEALAEAGVGLRARWGDGTAPPIGTLPRSVGLAPLLEQALPLQPLLGLGERELRPLAVELAEGNFLVTGPNRSGKSTALAALALGLRHADPSLDMRLLAPRRTPLLSLGIWSSVARGGDAIDEACQELLELLGDRDVGAAPIVLVLDDGHEIADSQADSQLETIIRRGRDADVHVIASTEVAAAHRSYGGWLPELRKDRQGLLLQPDPDLDGDLLGVRLAKSRTAVVGRGALVGRTGVQFVQVAFSG